MKTEQVLEVAQALITGPDHWIQGSYRKNDSYCALGAMREVYRRDGHKFQPEFTKAAIAFREVLNQSGWTLSIGIGGWNDRPERTHDEVIAMFEKARAYAAEYNL